MTPDEPKPADAKPAPAKIDPAQTRPDKEFKYTAPLLAGRFDPSGKYLFVTAQDFTIQRVELASGKLTALAGHDTLQLGFPGLSFPFWFAKPENRWATLFNQYFPSWATVQWYCTGQSCRLVR